MPANQDATRLSGTNTIPLKALGLYLVFLFVVYLLPGFYGVDGSGLGFFVFGLFGGIAILFAQANRDEVRRLMLIRDTPTQTVRALSIGDAEIKGKVRPVDGPVEAPVSQTPACIYELELQTDISDKKNRGEPEWQTRFSYQGRAPFVLDDGTGAVQVEPDRAELRVEEEAKLEVPEGEAPPKRLVEWADGRNFLDPVAVGEANSAEGYEEVDTALDLEAIEDGSKETVSLGDVGGAVASAATGSDSPPDPDLNQKVQNARAVSIAGTRDLSDRRFVERVLSVDEEAYVFGGVHRKEDADSAENVENLVVRGHSGTGYFLVSDRSEDEILSEGTSQLKGDVVIMALILLGATLGLIAHLTTLL